jgi:ATP-dependent Clp protease ATP-binding subunit ClpA
VLSRNLESSLHRALACANERRHEYATLEHLLLALTEDQDAVAVLRACGVDLDRLRREVLNYVDNELGNLVAAHGDDAKPTATFQRVLQRAAIHVQSSGREDVTSANVLVAMFAERESQAVHFLQGQGMTRFDAVNHISHGIAKVPGLWETRLVQGETTPDPGSVRVGQVAWIKASADDESATFQLGNYDRKSRSIITDPTTYYIASVKSAGPCCSI